MEQQNLEELKTSLLGQVADARDLAGAGAGARPDPGQEGPGHPADEEPWAACRRTSPQGARPGLQPGSRARSPTPSRRGARTWRRTRWKSGWRPSASTSPCRPGRRRMGRIHPISRTVEELVAIFGEMGFTRRRGPPYRGRFPQLHGPQHPGRASRPPGAGHLLSAAAPRTERAHGAAHPHLAGADPHHAVGGSRRSASSCPAAPSAATTTPPTRRCSIRSKAWWSTSRPTWAISRAP